MTAPDLDFLAPSNRPHGVGYLVDELAQELVPDVGAVTERELALYARRLLTGATPAIPHDWPSDLPPLYEPAGDGAWTFNGALYSPIEARAWVTDTIRQCRGAQHGLYYFCIHFAYTLNLHIDEETAATIPGAELIPDWPFVRATLGALHHGYDIVIEKSRDMMVSWMAMASCVYDLIFRPRWPVMTLSRVEKLVDDGGMASTVTSLHGKIRAIFENLPRLFRDAVPLEFKYLMVNSPIMESVVTGFPASSDPGRAGKFKRAVLDEFASTPHSEQVMMAVTRACPRGKVLISTPKGKANAFYRIRSASREIWPSKEPFGKHWLRVRIHWSQHPFRDEAWYAREVASQSMTEAAVAQELDIDYEGAVVGRVYPAFVYERHVQPLQYDPRRALIICCDFNHNPLIWEVCQVRQDRPTCHVIGEICRLSAMYNDAVLEFTIRYGAKSTVEALFNLDPNNERRYGTGGVMLAGDLGQLGDVLIYGDATEQKSTLYARQKMYDMIVGQLKDYGFNCKRMVPEANPPIITRIETLGDALRQNVVTVDPTCEQLIKDFQSGVWDSRQKDMDQMHHDDDEWALTRSHASSALGYYMVRHHKVKGSGDARSRGVAQNLSALVNRWR